jgi:hypothetical protein
MFENNPALGTFVSFIVVSIVFFTWLYLAVFKTDTLIKINEDWRKGQQERHERRMSTLGTFAGFFFGRKK